MGLVARRMAKGFVVLGLLLAARFACAQTTGDLDGAVTDSSNAPLPGVSLEARSPSLQGVRTTTSDHRGLFRFPILPPGTYTVSTSLSGFKPAVRTNLRVGLGETTFAPMFTLSVARRMARSEIMTATGE